MNYRAPWHDYRGQGIYHLTICKAPLIPDFGRVTGSADNPSSCRVERLDTGRAVLRTLAKMVEEEPRFKLYQYALMPDHIHILLGVTDWLEQPLGRYLAAFKHKASLLTPFDSIFTEGFHDRILRKPTDLPVCFNYLRQNPYRLVVRRERPEFFRRSRELTIGGEPMVAYGNLFLLRNPFKEQVVVHRADSPQTRERHREEWLCAAANGGVLVSPFISPDEKKIRDEALALGGRLILLVPQIPGGKWKPSQQEFDLCCAGRLLLLAPRDGHDGEITRSVALKLNHFSEKVCSYQEF